ncbi:TIGR03546 family protein [Alkalimonas collagenimarina]|uniref:TIGR03546 family protein n=1 Tax=Alkalimonas collagenimarina TaxID=400390 RepID=A0ABT9H3J0_9GAMM|nr:TIGR03546 family protein [Alkalimonas collagenimarina]MDP4537891.1 TIGR03546 family protein [Alkalimonas collagenimarina]
MFTILARILKVLNSEASPWQIGWAVALGVIAGILPFGLLTLIILLVVCLFTINLSSFLLVWAFSKALLWLLADRLEQMGWSWGQQDWLLSLLSNSETLQLLHLHHSLTLGAFLLSVIILFPIAWLTTRLVLKYRHVLMPHLNKWKVVQLLKASKLAQVYQRMQ